LDIVGADNLLIAYILNFKPETLNPKLLENPPSGGIHIVDIEVQV
jgi:hypothetical protein